MLPHLLGVKLFEPGLLPLALPQAKHFCFGAEGDVDQLFVPPPLAYRAEARAQNDRVIANLRKK